MNIMQCVKYLTLTNIFVSSIKLNAVRRRGLLELNFRMGGQGNLYMTAVRISACVSIGLLDHFFGKLTVLCSPGMDAREPKFEFPR
jgi:hypothetical protein